jgi:heme oxygenase
MMRSAAARPEGSPLAAPPLREQWPDASVRSAVLLRLRRETATLHRRVENRLFPAALADRVSYAAMLAALLRLHEPLEAQFPTFTGFASLGIDLDVRRKSDRLRRDLTDLTGQQFRSEGLHLPLPDLAAALGAFYVLEGSTLGGRVLQREVRTRLGDVPTDFLSGYGDQTGRRWKETRAALVAALHPPESTAPPVVTANNLVAGAQNAFRAFDRMLFVDGWSADGSCLS